MKLPYFFGGLLAVAWLAVWPETSLGWSAVSMLVLMIDKQKPQNACDMQETSTHNAIFFLTITPGWVTLLRGN
jgi:hypothetical protein